MELQQVNKRLQEIENNTDENNKIASDKEIQDLNDNIKNLEEDNKNRTQQINELLQEKNKIQAQILENKDSLLEKEKTIRYSFIIHIIAN